MAVLLVPREQVGTVLDERISAGEELVADAELAEKASGYGDWIYLFTKWREHTMAELRAVYDGDGIPHEFDIATHTTERSSPRSTFEGAKSKLELGLWQLGRFVDRLPLAEEPEPLQAHPGKVHKTPPDLGASAGGPNVFIIHGRAAGGFRDSVARFIERLGLTPVILAEQASAGRTLIEKFEANALDVGYAIALLTPEDSAYGPGEEPPPRPNRARQNVILELGYFMASLGRKNVVALQQEGLEVPTDILGIVYIPLDEGGAWETLLARELQAANYDIDLAKLLG
jgi:Predicted nucleotide-binding protein containing TIR-like domain